MDLPPEFEAVGALAAGALIRSMVGDGWSSARTWFCDLFRRHRKNSDSRDAARLDSGQRALEAVSVEERAALAGKLEGEWTVRLTDFLADHPGGLQELQEFVARNEDKGPRQQVGHNIKIEAKADRKATQNVTGIGDINTGTQS